MESVPLETLSGPVSEQPDFTPNVTRELQATGDLPEDLRSAVSQFITMSEDDLMLVVAFVLASWFPECFEAVPYLWIVGPLGSAKTKLLKLLSCLCPRSRLVSDIRSAALYQVVQGGSPPTLLIDEMDIDQTKSNSEILRLLRTGTTRGVPTVRNGREFSTYCFKAIASRQLPADGALASRCVMISLLPCEKELAPLDDSAMRHLTERFEPRLQVFRDAMKADIEGFQRQPRTLPNMTPRMRQIGRVLMSSFVYHPEQQALLAAILTERDESMRSERFLEPEWLVAETLFRLLHPLINQHINRRLTVGMIAAEVDHTRCVYGEGEKLSPRKVGATLASLGLKTSRLGNLGRGMELTGVFQRQVHAIARRLGIDRRNIANDLALEAGNGGFTCQMCDEFGLTAGLRDRTWEEARQWRRSFRRLFGTQDRLQAGSNRHA